MPVPRRRHSKGKRDRSRTHKKLSQPTNLMKCPNCGEDKLPHHACPACGTYKNRNYKVVVQS